MGTLACFMVHTPYILHREDLLPSIYIRLAPLLGLTCVQPSYPSHFFSHLITNCIIHLRSHPSTLIINSFIRYTETEMKVTVISNSVLKKSGRVRSDPIRSGPARMNPPRNNPSETPVPTQTDPC